MPAGLRGPRRFCATLPSLIEYQRKNEVDAIQLHLQEFDLGFDIERAPVVYDP
ncbi:MAG: hypothetical protein ACRD1X_02680 [Vicinamibacteria bacterium]